MTDHAALIAKLEALRERAVNDSFSVENEFATSANDEAECRQEREETNAAIDEAIAALQATPAEKRDPKTLPKDQERLYDLVRYARGFLSDAGLINLAEYTALASTGPVSARRLEGYDAFKLRADAAEAQLAAQRTALEQLIKDWRAQATEEAIDRDPGWVGAESTLRACADELVEILQDPQESRT